MILELRNIFFYFLIFIFLSCNVQIDFINNYNESKKEVKKITETTISKDFKGWWIYGDGYHLFKDEITLLEFNLEFPNENMNELKELYLAICEMEYFPMECKMTGKIKEDSLKGQSTLVVSEFEILYIEGCGE